MTTRSRLRQRRRWPVVSVVVLAAVAVAVAVVVHRHGGVGHSYRRVRDAVRDHLHGDGGGLTDARGTKVVRFDERSHVLGRSLAEVVVLPPGFESSQHRPLLVFLHGKGSSPNSLLNDHLTAGLAAAGARAPVVLLANGSDDSYFHDRATGKFGTEITDELVPEVQRRYDLDASRIGYAGVSMGGYGALELTREASTRTCGVAGLAPALFLSAGQTAPGAYDDAADFAAHDVLGAVRRSASALHGTPVFLAGGDDDPFRPGTTALATALRGAGQDVVRRMGPGGHTGSYWNPQFEPMLGWFAKRFEACGK